jgi:hypothetical protein
MIGRGSLLASLSIAAFLVSACGEGPTPSPTASHSPSPIPSVGPPVQQAALVVTGSGSISTYPWSGCQTTLRINPSGTTPDSEHFPGDYLFPSSTTALGSCRVTGGPLALPAAIPVGTYQLIVSTYRPSDVPTSFAPEGTLDYGVTQCSEVLTVLAAWSEVKIDVTFKDPGCTITVSSA